MAFKGIIVLHVWLTQTCLSHYDWRAWLDMKMDKHFKFLLMLVITG